MKKLIEEYSTLLLNFCYKKTRSSLIEKPKTQNSKLKTAACHISILFTQKKSF